MLATAWVAFAWVASRTIDRVLACAYVLASHAC
jgi:hypothetical protein